jgi:hypothetical protein
VAKQSGLGDAFFVSGYDLSGDTASLDEIGGGPALIDVTGINKSAFERIGGLRDGHIEWTSHFNDAASQEHPVLSTLPTTDRILTYCRSTTLGNPAACLTGKQLNYDMTRADDGKLSLKVRAEANGYGIEWGKQLTAGKRTDTAATTGTAVEFGYSSEDFLFLDGSSGNYASTPDAASLDIVGDIDLRVRVAMDDWTPAAESTLIAKYTATGNQRSYALAVTATGALILRWSEDGTAQKTATSSAANTFTNGTTHWVRATLDVNNGAADAAINFYTSEDGSTWTALGTQQLNGATTSIFASTAVLELGSQTGGTVNLLAGKIFQAQVLTGIAGTAVAAPIASTTSITDATPLTWTVQGTAYLSSHSTFGGQAYLQVFSFTGTDATVKLQHSHDNTTFADITGGAFTAIGSAPTTERIATASDLEIRRYVRAVTTTATSFTSLVFSVMFTNNTTSVVF